MSFFALLITVIGFGCVPVAHANTLSPTTIKSMVEKYFKDAPDMVSIAQCESGFRQFDSDGTVLRGGYGDEMIGVYQIDETVHRDTALSMGYDIDSFLGNILYARYLYVQDGVNPWIGCVGHAPEAVAATTPTPSPEPVTPETSAPAPNLSPTTAVAYIYDDAEERIRRASYADMLALLLEKRRQGLL